MFRPISFLPGCRARHFLDQVAKRAATWRIALAMLAVLAVLAVPPPVARAQSCGFPVAVASGSQKPLKVVADGAGGVYLAFYDSRSGLAEIRVMRLGPDGTPAPGWPADGVLDGRGGDADLAVALDGGVYVCRAHGTGISLQRYSADGTVYPGWPAAGTTVILNTFELGTTVPRVTIDAAGGAYVSWVVRGAFPGGHTRMMRFNGAGESAWTWSGDGSNEPPGYHVFPDGAGNVLMVHWFTYYNSIDVFKIQSNGAWTRLSMTNWALYCMAQGQRAVSNGANGALITWFQHCPNTNFAAQVGPSGAILPGWGPSKVIANSASNSLLAAPDGAGGALFAWFDGATSQLKITRYDASGAVAAGWTAAGRPLGSVNSGSGLSIVSDGAGGAFAVWPRPEASGLETIMRQHVLGDGTLAPGHDEGGEELCLVDLDNNSLVLTATSSGRAFVLWGDKRNTPAPDLYGAHLLPDGFTATELIRTHADASPGRVSVVWETRSASRASYSVERSAAGGAWESMGSVVAASDGRIAWEDAAVRAGARYGYRLREAGASTPWTATEIWVDVPRALRLAIEALTLDPSGGALSLTIALPEAGAMIDVYDVTGRQVMRETLADLPSGRHEVQVIGEARLGPGVYLARLRQHANQAVRRFVHAP
jgi:hypothetical protein